MKYIIPAGLLCIGLFSPLCGFSQSQDIPPKTQIMTLGVFHFAYPNLDAVKIGKEDQISVLEEPWQNEIERIADALETFNPTVIAVEFLPEHQSVLDSLYREYRAGNWTLEENEVYQLGFRLAKRLGLASVYAVDDRGRHYKEISRMFEDDAARTRFEEHYFNSADSIYYHEQATPAEAGIIGQLAELNQPERINDRLGVYLLNPFKYEEKEGDFTGADFETGRWFNRNLRIFRNIQRLSGGDEERILLIIGGEHLNLLNHFFDVSREFDLVSPLPLLQKAEE